jgi:hypothetical protein
VRDRLDFGSAALAGDGPVNSEYHTILLLLSLGTMRDENHEMGLDESE